MKRKLNWAFRHAWRDARASRRRLLLYMGAIVAGVAALVAIRAFSDNLTSSVDTEAKTLLGADLELYRREPFTDEALQLADRFGDDRLEEISLGTMAYFPRTRDSRLVRLRGVESAYPYYGDLRTVPAEAAGDWHSRGGALVDATLMLQFGVEVGDVVRVGALELPVLGALERIPGEVPTASLVGPRVLVPRSTLERAGLLGPGSQARYALQYRLDATPEEVVERVESVREDLRAQRIEVETVQYRRRSVGRALDNLYEFLYLAGFAALLLGGVGVASAMSLHARDKVPSVAALRCLGASRWLPVGAFLFQVAAMALVGSTLGAAVGVVAQRLLPPAVDAFLPLPVDFAISWRAVAEGLATGTLVAVLFAALPLLPLRRVTPLQALRLFATPPRATLRDPWVLGIGILLALALWGAAWTLTGEADTALAIVGGIGVVVTLLAATAFPLRALARRIAANVRAYPVRQGVANLYRPRNQTVAVLVTLGFGAFVVGSLLVLQASLLASLDQLTARSAANFVLFDVQPDQRESARGILADNNVEVLQDVAIVPMRLASLKGRPISEFTAEDGIPGWALRREYNSTYRAELDDTEVITAGAWVGAAAPGETAVPVSLEADIAADLGVGIDDELAFDVQGVEIPVVVASIRTVDWQQVRPNFFVLFPTGVLENAPQQIAIVGRVESPEASASVQRALVESLRNISVIDLGLVLRTIDEVLDQVRLAIRFMTLFVLAAGGAVLLAAVHTSRRQRETENVLLRTLGASRQQLLRILGTEYFALGALAALTGLVLSAAAGVPLMHYVFDVPLRLPYAGFAVTLAGIVVVTAVVGLWGSRGVTSRPPLQSLRADVEAG